MAFWDNVKKFLGFGDDDEKKKQQQRQAQNRPTQNFQAPQKAPGSVVNQNRQQAQQVQSPTSQRPDNGVSLVLPGQTRSTPDGFPALLKKSEPAAAPAADPKKDRRGLLSKVYDTVNTNDSGRSWSTAKPSASNKKNSAEQTGDVARYLLNNTAKVVNTGGEAVRTSAELGRALTGRATGNKEAETAAIDRALSKDRSLLEKGRGVLGVGGALTAEEAQNGMSAGDFTKRVAGTGFGTAGEILPGARPLKGTSRLRKAARGGTEGAVIATAGDVGNQMLDDKAGIDLKQTAAAAGFGTVLGGVSANFPGAELRKPTVVEKPEPDSAGLKSVNPTREADATAQLEAQAIKDAQAAQAMQPLDDVNTPAYLRKPEKEAAKIETAKAEESAAIANGAGTAPTDRPTFQHRQDIRNIMNQGDDELNDFVNSKPEATMQEIEAAKADIQAQVVGRIEQLRNARYGDLDEPVVPRPSTAATPVAAEVVPSAATVTPEPTNIPGAEPAMATPVEQAAPAQPTPVTQTGAEPVQIPGIQAGSALPEIPGSGQATVDVAPRSHDALVKSLGAPAEALKGQYSKKLPVNIDELKENATARIAAMSDDELVQTFQTADPASMITNSQNFSLARAALDRLGAMPDNPQAVQLVTNIMDAMDNYVSKSGEALRIVQEEFDNLPLPMKIRYIVKRIDRANADTKNYSALADDPARAEVVEATLSGHLNSSQAIGERVSALQGQLENAADAAKRGELVNSDLKGLARTLETEKTNLQAANGELVKYFETLVPGRKASQRLLVDWPKRLMLSSFSGRLNDLLTTSANIGNLTATNVTQGVLAKAVNLVKGKGTVSNTFKGTSKLFTGGAKGLKKTGQEISKGTQYTDNVQGSLRSNEDMRTGLRKARGPVSRTIQAATEAATKLSEGVRDQRLVQLADQEASQAGLTGALRKQYVDARAAVPSRQMLERADQLHMEINNLNENPVTRGLNRVASGIEGNSAVGGILKNQILPFTSWLGGNIYNSITDKNVIASTIKFGRDAFVRKDPEGAVRNLAKAVNGAATAYAVGYALTETGILTQEDAQGYNDAGAYFHIGDRYIPVGNVGFFAPNLVLGMAAYNGMNTEEGESPAEAIGSTIGSYAWNGLALGSALGTESSINRAVNAGSREGAGWLDGVSTAVGGAVGQVIPALAGDVNAVLNNYTSLNPTKEASDTKVADPNSKSGNATDRPATEVQKLKNRIPFLSQTLPRKADVAADDPLDRVTRGNRDTPGGVQAKADVKTAEEKTKDFAARNVPNPDEPNFDDAVKARVENGEWDSAIEGLQAKLATQEKNSNIPKSKNQAISDQIKTIQVHKSGEYPPEFMSLYDKTSLTEWRDFGDPESDTYDPDMYQKIYDYDSDRAKAGVSRNTDKKGENFYSAKKEKTGSGGSGSRGGRGSADPELARIKSNTVGSLDGLSKFSFDLAPQKAGSVKMQKIQQIRSSDLVKKRMIKVSKA